MGTNRKGVIKVAKCFSIDLNYFTLERAIGSSEVSLQRKIDRMDVVSILIDEGYRHIEDSGPYVRIRDQDKLGLRGAIQNSTIGISANSRVNIRWLGNTSRLLLSFLDDGELNDRI